MSDKLYSKILGCMLGNAIGDAFGGIVEFCDAERVKKITGGFWVDEFLPYPEDHARNPLGTWESAPPRGTGTDDTRNNHAFVECVIRNNGFINPQLLAIEYIERYRDSHILYPQHAELAKGHFAYFYDKSCARLGMTDLPSANVQWTAFSDGNESPVLFGLISLAFAGLLYQNEPEKAYRKAFELDFIDVGYAKDATAMMAAMISAGLKDSISAKEMVEIGLQTDPFGFGRDRVMSNNLRKFLQIADQANDNQALINELAMQMKNLHPFDPIDALGISATALYYSDGDPIQTIIMAANDRDLDENGELKKLRDVDCTAGIAGAIAGVLCGIEAFPDDWIKDAIKANKDIYGIDIEENAKLFYKLVYGNNEILE